MTKTDTAKDVLLTAANDNPAATICITVVNGQTKFGMHFPSLTDLLVMKWVLSYEIEKTLKKGFGIDQPVVEGQEK